MIYTWQELQMWIVKIILGNKIHRVIAYIYFCMYLRQYLAQFFLEWEMFQKKVVEKTKTHILFSIDPPPPQRKSWRLWDNVEKYDTARETIHDNKTRCMRFCKLDN